MAQKTYTVVIEERKLQSTAPAEKLTAVENTFKNIIQEINVSNGQADLWVVSVEEQT